VKQACTKSDGLSQVCVSQFPRGLSPQTRPTSFFNPEQIATFKSVAERTFDVGGCWLSSDWCSRRYLGSGSTNFKGVTLKETVIILVGRESLIPAEVRDAWKAAGVNLLGPLSPQQLDVKRLQHTVGLIIDVSQDPDALFELSELLEQRRLPYVYALRDDQLKRRDGAYVVSSEKAHIKAIIDALTSDGDDGIRH